VAGNATTRDVSEERLTLGDRARPLFTAAAAVAIVGLAIALILGWVSDHSLRRLYFGYLTAFVFFLSIVLGALFMVLMQFLTRAAWSVGVRRIAENLTGLMPVLGILAIPLIATVAVQRGTVYRWALPITATTPQAIEAAKHGETEEVPEAPATTSSQSVAIKDINPPPAPLLDSTMLQKRAWMNPIFWIIRVVIYFIAWSWISLYYRRLSILQDENGDPELTRRRQIWSGICVVILGLTLTGAAGDFIMSLDPHWFSTIFGVYYFAGGALASWATLIIITRLLQRGGFLTRSVTIEHYHDLGKYLFGFTFFWGYIAFSQYMLLWYASIPEEIEWYNRHGATTVHSHITGWSYVIVAILFGQLLIPFAGLLSRYVKREISLLIFWAFWVVSFHYLDTYWMVMPEYHVPWAAPFRAWSIVIDLAALAGIGGVLAAALVRLMAPHSLRPTGDPRLPESLAFHNF
jgi:hypothetical protein